MNELIIVSVQDMQRIEQRIAHAPRLSAMIDADPEVLALLKMAASAHQTTNRWHEYEKLKTLSKTIVGWGARTPALRAPGCYETFIDAIDALLPAESDGEAIELEAS